MAKVRLHTGPGVFAVLANVCRNPQEALKQFVENAADAIDQAKTEEGYIRVKLEYEPADNGLKQGILRRLAIEDNGGGMTREKMNQVLRRIGDSEKINLALRGEQGIGLLAFALIAQELASVHLKNDTIDDILSSTGGLTLDLCLDSKKRGCKNGYSFSVFGSSLIGTLGLSSASLWLGAGSKKLGLADRKEERKVCLI